MRTLAVIGLSAAVAAGAALSPDSAVAQQKSLKDQLVGTWTLASCTRPTGSAEVCANPHGMLILEAGGHYAQVLTPHGRPSLSGPRSALSADQFSHGRQCGGQFRNLVGQRGR
jgi:hypothetical protein